MDNKHVYLKIFVKHILNLLRPLLKYQLFGRKTVKLKFAISESKYELSISDCLYFIINNIILLNMIYQKWIFIIPIKNIIKPGFKCAILKIKGPPWEVLSGVIRNGKSSRAVFFVHCRVSGHQCLSKENLSLRALLLSYSLRKVLS